MATETTERNGPLKTRAAFFHSKNHKNRKLHPLRGLVRSGNCSYNLSVQEDREVLFMHMADALLAPA
ncbi:MAG: hypothetical protein IKK28_14660, partial [Mogibacterium sp.]|nr:hypothetical protein [Mogibacterium sp.]